MQELRLVMIVIGAVAIVALLIHGLWASRKERPEKFGERPIQKVVKKDKDGFDQDGLGAVRVVKSSANTQDESEHLSDDPLFYSNSALQRPTQRKTMERKIERNQPSAPHIKMKAVKDFYHFEDTEEDIALAEEEALRYNQSQQPAAKFEEEEFAQEQQEFLEQEQNATESQPQQEVLIFNVQAPSNNHFKGTDVFNCLEQYGMQLGEMNIFHRQIEVEGRQKVLFSAANIFNPGSFPVAAIHQFTTPGITFFMTLPCYGEAEQNFKLMLKTAQQVADLLGGNVTDDGRNLLTPKRIGEYRDKVRQYMVVS